MTGPVLFLLLQDSPLAFHMKWGWLTDADDSLIYMLIWLTDDVASLR